MTDFTLGQDFNLILLAGAAVWLLNEPQRAKMFENVRDHLLEGDRFYVTMQDFPGPTKDSPAFENIVSYTAPGDPGSLYTFFDYADLAEGLRTGAILRHKVKDGAVVETQMISGLNYLVTPAEITAEIEHAGLRVLAQHDVARPQVLTGTRPTTKLMLEASL